MVLLPEIWKTFPLGYTCKPSQSLQHLLINSTALNCCCDDDVVAGTGDAGGSDMIKRLVWNSPLLFVVGAADCVLLGQHSSSSHHVGKAEEDTPQHYSARFQAVKLCTGKNQIVNFLFCRWHSTDSCNLNLNSFGASVRGRWNSTKRLRYDTLYFI